MSVSRGPVRPEAESHSHRVPHLVAWLLVLSVCPGANAICCCAYVSPERAETVTDREKREGGKDLVWHRDGTN